MKYSALSKNLNEPFSHSAASILDTSCQNKPDHTEHFSLQYLTYCYMLQKEMSTTLSMEYSDYTVFINPGKVIHSIKFNLNDEDKRSLIECGYQGTKLYFESNK